MSYTETHSGIIKKFVPPFGNSYLDWAKESLKSLKVEYEPKWYYDEIDQLLSEFYDEYDHLIRIGDDIYKFEDKELDDNEMCQITIKSDGSYSYVARFYNGGTCLPEVLKDKLEHIITKHKS